MGVLTSNNTSAASWEDHATASYLYELAQVISWPLSAFADSDAPFRICILGWTSFRKQLDFVIKNKRAKQRRIVVQSLAQQDKLTDCQILFIAQSEQRRFADIIAGIEKYPIVTVGDIAGFFKNGGMFELYKHKRQVYIAFDPETISEAGLKANAELLRISQSVYRKK
ncbi:MAG: YfiR family protein [Gammaproteobacteria bacterium]|nr:YfiR family protein [Gammaproteobacteria bacterium]